MEGSVTDIKFLPCQTERPIFHRGEGRLLQLPRLSMRQSSKVKEYFFEDLETLTQTAREVWLAEQCSSFEHEIRKFLPDRDAFLEDLYKKLKKITRRWSSWNHRAFGIVTSRENIRELSVWEVNNLPRHMTCPGNKDQGQSSSSETSEGNPLDHFETFCKQSEKILRIFRRDIYRPLCDFFSLDTVDTQVRDIPKSLERCLQRWETLLSSMPINEKLFSKASELTVFKTVLKNRSFEFDIVLRLIPDLLEKKIEALRLARRWRLLMKSNEVKRRGTYTIPHRVLSKRDALRPPSVVNGLIDEAEKGDDDTLPDLHEAEKRYQIVMNELEESKKYCTKLEDQMGHYRQECENLKSQLKETKENCCSLQEKLSMSHQTDLLHNEDLHSSEEYCKVLHRELEAAKMRYCTQKIKFMNARKRVENLNTQLVGSQQRYIKLEEELGSWKEKCSKIQDQLELTRKNVHTQGKMIDALQEQCYTLNQELDRSNISKGELYEELEVVRTKYQTLEHSLRDSKLREEDLERENTYLRDLCKTQSCDANVKKAGMFPDIRKSRSL